MLTDIQMGTIVQKDKSVRLLEECNRVCKNVSFSEDKDSPPGDLMDTYIEQEKKLLNVKANFFVWAPVATHQEVIDTMKSWSWKWKE